MVLIKEKTLKISEKLAVLEAQNRRFSTQIQLNEIKTKVRMPGLTSSLVFYLLPIISFGSRIVLICSGVRRVSAATTSRMLLFS